MPECPKCKDVLDFINGQRANPPKMSFEVELPYKDALETIEKIITTKSPIEKALERVKQTGNIEDARKYQKIRRAQETLAIPNNLIARRFKESQL